MSAVRPPLPIRLWYLLFYYAALLFFALGSAGYNFVALILCRLPLSVDRQRFFQGVVRRLLALYVSVLRASGAMHTRFPDWERMAEYPGGLILANHPSILDAPLILARQERVICFFKSSLRRHLLTGAGARLAGFIGNDSGIEGVRAAVEHIRQGGWVLLFPEGTRTTGKTLLPFHSGYALIAARARCPIVCLHVHTDSNALTKNLPFWKAPRLPAIFTVRILGVVEAGEKRTSADWVEAVEAVYQDAPPSPLPA